MKANRIRWRTVALAILATCTLPPLLEAQEPQRPVRSGRRGSSIPSVEQILRMRERLELTEDQVAQLQTLRREAVETRRARMGELMELRSRLQAGDATREEWRDELAARRETVQARMQERQERVTGILSEQQRERLQSARRRVGRGDRLGPRGRGGRSFRRGGPRRGGRAFGPRQFHRRRGPGRWFAPRFRP